MRKYYALRIIIFSSGTFVSNEDSQYVILSDERSEESLQSQLANIGLRDFSSLCSSK